MPVSPDATPPARSKPRSPIADCLMVNRNAGAGTRVLIDRLLAGARPAGYSNQPRSHNAVAAAVAQGRADWGIAIESVAQLYGLGFLPIAPEDYDFLLVESRRDRPAVAGLPCGAARSGDARQHPRARHAPRGCLICCRALAMMLRVLVIFMLACG